MPSEFYLRLKLEPTNENIKKSGETVSEAETFIPTPGRVGKNARSQLSSISLL